MSNYNKKPDIKIIKKDTWPNELRPNPSQLPSVTDTYFLRTRDIVSSYGDTEVTYAIFMRRPVISALNLAIDWLEQIVKERKGSVNIKRCFKEGSDVGAGEPLVYISGSMLLLVDLETALLQKIGATCVAAYNARSMVEPWKFVMHKVHKFDIDPSVWTLMYLISPTKLRWIQRI